jgi:hypothetical protein
MFVIKQDLYSTLNENDINVLTESELDIYDAIKKAIEHAKSFIQHRYDESAVFFDMDNYDHAKAYAIGDLVYHTCDTWVTTTTYASGARILYQGKIYKSLQAANLNKNPVTQTAWWDELYDEYTKFTCKAVSTAHYPDETTYWDQVDSRNSLIVDAVSVVAIYNLFRKCQPTNIPEWISTELSRQETILKEIGNGKRTLILTVLLDDDGIEQGHNITYGSETAKTWDI